MPFGLSGAAPNFQKAIDIILKPVIGRFVSVYMDDVIITSPSFNEHLDHLNQVFTLLRDAGLTLNKDKCHFARDKLKCLGLVISKEGIETDNSKVKAITEMKPPKNSKEVSKCLGMAGWYQKFIPKNPVGNLDGSQISCAALRALALNSREQLIREQREDPELGHIYRDKRVKVNIDQVRVYRPRQSDTISSDSHVEAIYEGQRSSDRSSRSKPGKFKGSRKTSSEESNGHKSSKGNDGWEDLRLKRKVESNGSGDLRGPKFAQNVLCRGPNIGTRNDQPLNQNSG
ncbi:retrovirus-related Pol polyprotein from transposon 297 [Trichonephila clavipes]|nr:retrovirus-related Pol polyprotein from transposon 297 [Trichonephila clavipes]